VRVDPRAVALRDYPGGPRPSSVIRITGGERDGLGENVAFTEAEHVELVHFAERWLRAATEHTRGPITVQIARDFGAFGALYERAALEAALIDLALRQADLALHDFTGVRERALRFVASFGAPHPDNAIRELRASGFAGDLKIDVDPSWGRAAMEELSREPQIAILDFKSRGDARLVEQLAALIPNALLEDPPGEPASLAIRTQRISRDASLTDENAVAAACARGESVNLKAPRMGGPLAVLRSLELARGTDAYLGGMFEVGVGRSQAQQIAALYCCNAPNDLAPNVPTTGNTAIFRTNSPLHVRLDEPGFGRR
jgi:L-alanine-DL-glutamate epimerase-like enolase superfamily enzyme